MAREGALGSGEMIRVVMAVSRGQHLDGHAEIARCFPHVGAGLHQPCRGGVAQDVREDFVTESATPLPR
jgi:hypothetical protein